MQKSIQNKKKNIKIVLGNYRLSHQSKIKSLSIMNSSHCVGLKFSLSGSEPKEPVLDLKPNHGSVQKVSGLTWSNGVVVHGLVIGKF